MENLAQTILTITCILLIPPIIWCTALLFKIPKNRNAPLPPGPRGFPILGYLPYLGTELQSQFAEMAQKHGPIFKLKLGTKLCVVLSSPSLVREVTRDQDTVFANRDPPVAAEVISRGGFDIAWAAYGSYWRNMRKLFVREMLSGTNLEACHGLRKEEVTKAVKQVGDKLGTPVKIGELTFLTEINVVMRMLWGSTLEEHQQSSLGADFRVVFGRLIDLLGKPNLSDFFPVLRRFDIQGVEREARDLLKLVDGIFDGVMNERAKMDGKYDMASAGRGKDFVQILHEIKNLDTGEEVTMMQRKGILMDIVVGGTDTTATMTEWAMSEILHHREVMEKVRVELDSVVGVNSVVEEFHLDKLHYLEAAVKETFRLHPAIPFLVPRRPTKTSTVGGYCIPEGTRVFINAWAIHRDPQLWDDPMEFKPERFLEEAEKWDYNGNNFQYIPFGSGRRVCPGITLAEKMLMYLLASLLHSFDWKPTKSKEEDLTEKFGIVLKKSTPLVAIPTKRTRHLA